MGDERYKLLNTHTNVFEFTDLSASECASILVANGSYGIHESSMHSLATAWALYGPYEVHFDGDTVPGGQYKHTCVKCKRSFFGNKFANACQQCFAKRSKEVDKWSQEAKDAGMTYGQYTLQTYYRNTVERKNGGMSR